MLATLVVWVAVRMPLSHYASIWRSFYKKIDGARYARGLGLRLSGRFCVLHLNIAVFNLSCIFKLYCEKQTKPSSAIFIADF